MAEQLTILLVDDSTTMRNFNKRALSDWEHVQFIEAGDGLDALDVCREREVDLILLDWNMPAMNGLSFLKRFREFNDKTPVIMVTTEREKYRYFEAIKQGANNYLRKPFTIDALRSVIQQTLDKAQRNQAMEVD